MGVDTDSKEIAERSRQRVLDAALACMARWGLSKTTLDDVARAAGLSRATVYRCVPGGKNELVSAVIHREVERASGRVRGVLDAAGDLETLLVEGIVAVAVEARDHELLRTVLEHEPESLLPVLAFDRVEPLLALGATVFEGPIARHLPEAVASELAEWVARIIISYTFVPGTLDLCDTEQVRNYVSTYLLAGTERAVNEPRRAAVTVP